MLAEECAAIELAYDTYFVRLVRYMTSMTRDPDEARDLAEEAFVRLSQAIAAGRAPSNTGAWLWRVGANLACSRSRHLQVVDRRSAELPLPSAPGVPEELVIGSERWRALAQCIAELSRSEGRAVVLAARGHRAPEIAIEMGRTPGAVRTLLCRSRAKLRRRFAELDAVP